MKKQTMMKMILALGVTLALSACGTARAESGTQAGTAAAETFAAQPSVQVIGPETTADRQGPGNAPAAQEAAEPVTAGIKEETQETMLQMKIGDTKVEVSWEDNDSVSALKALCKDAPLTIQMSMYGGFEQVGPIGTTLPSNDVQTRTAAGDIVLYSSSQIVVFYGSNSWAYTRLGHITDQDPAGMAALLGNGNVTICLSMEVSE